MSRRTPHSHRPYTSPPPPPPVDPTLLISDPCNRCGGEACDTFWTTGGGGCGVRSTNNYDPTIPGVFPYVADPETGTGCVCRAHCVAGTDERTPIKYEKLYGAEKFEEIYIEAELRHSTNYPFCGTKIMRLGDQSGSNPNVPGVNVGTSPGDTPSLQVGVFLGVDLFFQNINLLANWPDNTWKRLGLWAKRGTLDASDGAACLFIDDIQVAGNRALPMNIDAGAGWSFFWILANYSFASNACCSPHQPTACRDGDIFMKNIKVYSGKPNYVP